MSGDINGVNSMDDLQVFLHNTFPSKEEYTHMDDVDLTYLMGEILSKFSTKGLDAVLKHIDQIQNSS